MIAPSILLLAKGKPSDASPQPSLSTRFSAREAQLAVWVKTCADYYEAVVLYEQLSGLADTELHRRGISRATLARDVREACPSTANR